ncbi:MAG: hypothetical protein WCK65_06715 [Rhodospirillaceae bacterium]
MAKNTGDDYRIGSVCNRSQTYNPRTEKYVERDRSTGQFTRIKVDGGPFKGVAKEQDRRRGDK